MSEGSGVNKTQIWVAAITVIGSVLTALIVNIDKFGNRDSGSKVETSKSSAPNESSPPQIKLIDVNGEWRSDDGSRFSFTQSGSTYEYTHTAINGTFQSSGKGSISGRDLSHTFETLTGETGTCTGYADATVKKITGSCLNADGSWTYVIER